MAPFQAAHIPVAWVGLPPMRTDRLNAQVVKLNEIDKEHAEKAGAKYIDIWDAFADQNGQYDAFGPNVDGQNVKLRGADGILFTKAGARKVAHFLEAEIKRVFDKNKPQYDTATLPPDIEQAAGDINAQIRREMGAPEEPAAPGSPARLEPPKPLAGPILSLTGAADFAGRSAGLARSDAGRRTRRGGARASPGRARRSAHGTRRRFFLAASLAARRRSPVPGRSRVPAQRADRRKIARLRFLFARRPRVRRRAGREAGFGSGLSKLRPRRR